MDELTSLIQQGGGDVMNMINNQSGGAARNCFPGIVDRYTNYFLFSLLLLAFRFR